jgi:hypothetical protein
VAIKKAFNLWYSSCVAELSNRQVSREIRVTKYQQAISNLLSMVVLRDKAAVWASEGVKTITRPRQRDEKVN